MRRDSLPNVTYAGSMNNDDLLARHMSWLRRVTDRQETLNHRRDNLRRVARALPVELIEATADHLDTWQASLTVAVSSVHTYTNHVVAFYRWCQESGHRDDNPAEYLPRPRLPYRLPRPIPERDLRLAFKCATGDMVVWLALAGWCGLRAGEIARLRGEDVISEGGTMLLHVDGKGGKERIVPVPKEVEPLIRRVHKRGRLFLRPSGSPATPDYVSHVASEFLHGIGLPYTLHQLRHRFGTELYRVCKDIRQVQEVMGHASPSTTAGYVAVVGSRTAKSVNRLGRSLPKAS